jgi:hypothetical protein
MRGLEATSFVGVVMGVGLASLGLSCQPALTPTGEAGNGQFTYECPTGTVDVACPNESEPEASPSFEEPPTNGTTTLPNLIAIGATFSVTYVPVVNGGGVQGDSGYQVTPASTRLAEPSGDGLVAKHAGYLALLALSPGQTVDDFVFVRFAPIAAITPSSTEVSLPLGGSATLSVTAEDAQNEPLAGSLHCSWSVESGESVMLEGPTNGAAVRVEGVTEAEAVVGVTCGAATSRISIHVTSATDGGDNG